MNRVGSRRAVCAQEEELRSILAASRHAPGSQIVGAIRERMQASARRRGARGGGAGFPGGPRDPREPSGRPVGGQREVAREGRGARCSRDAAETQQRCSRDVSCSLPGASPEPCRSLAGARRRKRCARRARHKRRRASRRSDDSPRQLVTASAGCCCGRRTSRPTQSEGEENDESGDTELLVRQVHVSIKGYALSLGEAPFLVRGFLGTEEELRQRSFREARMQARQHATRRWVRVGSACSSGGAARPARSSRASLRPSAAGEASSFTL